MSDNSTREVYSISDAQAQRTYVSVRRAAQWVGFFLPYLKPGMSLLDCGCGVGSITLDLAELVAPGKVIGVDMDASQLVIARENAAKRNLSNVTFEQGNVYTLRFENETFDAVLAHTLLYHLSDQLRALQELRRVLKSNGVAAVSDDDWSAIIIAPETPLFRKGLDIMTRVIELNGGKPFYSRNLRALMLQAGFSETEGYAVAAEHYGTLAETRRVASVARGVITSPDILALITSQGWATETEVNEIAQAVQAWSERPDAFYAVMYCAAVGRNV